MTKLSFGFVEPPNFKHAFSPQEDERLRRLVAIYGDKEWKLVAQKMPNRTTRQCRERYKSYLAPDMINGPWTAEEDELLKQKYKEYGSKWSTIQNFFKSRSDVNIKNRWTIISGRMNKNHRVKAYLIKNIETPIQLNSTENEGSSPGFALLTNKSIPVTIRNNNTDNFDLRLNSALPIQHSKAKFLNQQSSSIDSPISPSSPCILAQISPPAITTQITVPRISIPIHNTIHNPIQDPIHRSYQTQTHISPNLSSTEPSIHTFTSLQHPIHFPYQCSDLPQYKKQKSSLNEPTKTLIDSSSDLNENKMQNNVIQKSIISLPKRKPFPPISSLSLPSDDRLMIADKLFLPNENRIDELIIASGPNLTLANNFPHYGGNIW